MKVSTFLKVNGATITTIRENTTDYKILCKIHYGIKPTSDWTQLGDGKWISEWGLVTYDSRIRVGQEILDRKIDFVTATDSQHITIYVK